MSGAKCPAVPLFNPVKEVEHGTQMPGDIEHTRSGKDVYCGKRNENRRAWHRACTPELPLERAVIFTPYLLFTMPQKLLKNNCIDAS